MDLPFREKTNHIDLELHISDILEVNDRDFSITFALYFNVMWQEPRLQLNPKFFPSASENDTFILKQFVPVDLNLVYELWVPNVFIYNLKTFKVLDILSKLAGLWVNAEHEILFSLASQITFICPMSFDYFPIDTQVCKFQVGSYSYNMEKMYFEAKHLGYAHTSKSIVLDYEAEIRPLSAEDKVFIGGSLGNFSLAGFEMVLKRHVSHYIINYYLPSGLFVIVSWISFLVPYEVIPGRMALLVTLFLVLVNIFNTVTTNTPKAEGLTAIEAWMLACILFVFGALVEYAVLLFVKGLQSSEGGEEEQEESENKRRKQKQIEIQDGGSLSIEESHRCMADINNESVHLRPLTSSTCSRHQILNGASTGEGDDEYQEPLEVHHGNGKCRRAQEKKKRSQSQTAKDKKLKRLFSRIDRFFIVAFPLLFGGFNVMYWTIYVYSQKEILEDSMRMEELE